MTQTLLERDAAACCTSINATGGLEQAVAQRLSTVFKALGDPTRVKLLSMIADADRGDACICDLTGPVGLTQPTVSHHMRLLVDAGLVTREQRGKWAHYSVAPGAREALTSMIASLVGERQPSHS